MKIEIISSDSGDWEALYINDDLITEGHKISPEELLFSLQRFLPHTFKYSFISDERAEEGFPLDRKDLVDYSID